MSPLHFLLIIAYSLRIQLTFMNAEKSRPRQFEKMVYKLSPKVILCFLFILEIPPGKKEPWLLFCYYPSQLVCMLGLHQDIGAKICKNGVNKCKKPFIHVNVWWLAK